MPEDEQYTRKFLMVIIEPEPVSNRTVDLSTGFASFMGPTRRASPTVLWEECVGSSGSTLTFPASLPCDRTDTQ